ncbi:hypothetical protein UA08_04034 [Talaromyces atroroseus]|uniref:WKF domain-containing protein n=1 Tax=Talaromyces atroroseus TaxID=1441469 RepID=A0A1Q5Q8D6_TALAT|nr:hypothetical protein UA08_04034 [Talaromyces atroroseus]OKL60398.1 hypothetical protein UA08_04034 [Talaromyces atroroseus]
MSLSKTEPSAGEDKLTDEVKVKTKRKDEKKEKKSRKTSKQGTEHDESNTVEGEKESKSKKRPRDEEKEEKTETEKVRKNKRKSVSFADDNDNDNVDAKDDTQLNPNDAAIDEEHLRKKRKQEKRAKREQRHKSDPSTSTSSTSTSTSKPATDTSSGNLILAYLSQYHNDRTAWKFQKIRETQLLKNVFSLEQVPAEYNLALLAYLKGLKSEGARTRLRKAAQEVIKVDEGVSPKENNNTEERKGEAEDDATRVSVGPVPESWKERYGDAVHRFKGNLNAGVKDLDEGVSLAASDEDDGRAEDVANIFTRFENRKRAEMVLWTVSGKISKSTHTSSSTSKPDTETEVDTSTTTTPASSSKNNKQKAPARKKRKNRTMIVEISSSSESSDSDSD